MSNLKAYRNQIDKLDKKLIEILSKRFEIAKKVGVYKKENNIPVLDKSREKDLLDTKEKLAKGAGIDGKFISGIFKLIIKESRKKQNELKRRK